MAMKTGKNWLGIYNYSAYMKLNNIHYVTNTAGNENENDFISKLHSFLLLFL